MSVAIVIPAQLDSKRFPNKPFTMIDGKLMIDRVIHNCLLVERADSVYVATPDIKIKEHVMNLWGELNVRTIITSTNNTTGNEAVAEAALQLDEEIIVNVQGDEPILEPSVIEYAIGSFMDIKHLYQLLNCYTATPDDMYFRTSKCIHTLVNKHNELIYMSRSPLPYNKNNVYVSPLKQVCVYVFKKAALIHLFRECKKGYIEKSEDICMLRAIENGYKVYMLPVSTNTHGVDTPEDVAIVESRIRGKDDISIT